MDSAWLDEGLLGRVRRIVRPWPCCLVGGAVRDHLLGRAAHDLDLVTAGGDAPSAALARQLPARLVPIGGDRFAATRLVGEGFVIDLWDRGELTLAEELARRDLTVNAIAVDLADGTWHDPHEGRRDLAAGLLRATTARSFAEDPLRVLRLARLAAELPSFEVEAGTRELAADSVAELSAIAAERRREEFARTLRSAAPGRGLAVWVVIGFYPGLLSVADVGAREAALRAFDRAEVVRRRFAELAASLELDRVPSPDGLTLHAGLLLGAAKVGVDVLLECGYLSRREARDLALALDNGRFADDDATRRWLLHRAGHTWPTALCLAAAMAPHADSDVEAALTASLTLVRDEGAAIFDPEPLLRGNEIRELLDLRSGPEVGLAARRLRRRQIEGRLLDRSAAVEWLLSERRSSDAD